MTFFFIGIALALFLWLVVQPSWLPQPNWLPKPPEKQLAQWTAQTQALGQTFKQRLRRLVWPFATPDTAAFKRWALDHLPALYAQQYPNDAEGLTAFQSWLTSLSENDFAAYARATAAFCEALGFELKWLWQTTDQSEQVATLSHSLLLHTQAYAKAHASQTFAAYVHWQQNPHAPAQQALTARLFNQLVAQQHLTCPPELLLAPAAERQAFVSNALNTFAQAQPTAFMVAFETALNAHA